MMCCLKVPILEILGPYPNLPSVPAGYPAVCLHFPGQTNSPRQGTAAPVQGQRSTGFDAWPLKLHKFLKESTANATHIKFVGRGVSGSQEIARVSTFHLTKFELVT